MTHRERLRIGQLSRLTGASADTLRHYERLGLLAPERMANGYRVYAPAAVDRVRMIRAALALGFRLDELARFFKLRASGRPPCREVRALAGAKLADLEALITRLVTLRDRLRSVISDWDRRLEDGAPPVRLLEALAETGFVEAGLLSAREAFKLNSREKRSKK
jgi:DNA-binding transcriptional MerR regulator